MRKSHTHPPPPPNAFIWLVGYWNADEDSHLFSESRTIDFENKDKREMIKKHHSSNHVYQTLACAKHITTLGFIIVN